MNNVLIRIPKRDSEKFGVMVIISEKVEFIGRTFTVLLRIFLNEIGWIALWIYRSIHLFICLYFSEFVAHTGRSILRLPLS